MKTSDLQAAASALYRHSAESPIDTEARSILAAAAVQQAAALERIAAALERLSPLSDEVL